MKILVWALQGISYRQLPVDTWSTTAMMHYFSQTATSDFFLSFLVCLWFTVLHEPASSKHTISCGQHLHSFRPEVAAWVNHIHTKSKKGDFLRQKYTCTQSGSKSSWIWIAWFSISTHCAEGWSHIISMAGALSLQAKRLKAPVSFSYVPCQTVLQNSESETHGVTSQRVRPHIKQFPGCCLVFDHFKASLKCLSLQLFPELPLSPHLSNHIYIWIYNLDETRIFVHNLKCLVKYFTVFPLSENKCCQCPLEVWRQVVSDMNQRTGFISLSKHKPLWLQKTTNNSENLF